MNITPTTSASRRDPSLPLQCACTLLVAIGAAYVSYRHGREFTLRLGADDTTATLWPLIVDGLEDQPPPSRHRAMEGMAVVRPRDRIVRCAPTSPPHPC